MTLTSGECSTKLFSLILLLTISKDMLTPTADLPLPVPPGQQTCGSKLINHQGWESIRSPWQNLLPWISSSKLFTKMLTSAALNMSIQ